MVRVLGHSAINCTTPFEESLLLVYRVLLDEVLSHADHDVALNMEQDP